MGKGDIKTRRGKIFNGSYGARRRKKSGKVVLKASKPQKTAGKSK
jgi:ribosomal small subunit protein bTHX